MEDEKYVGGYSSPTLWERTRLFSFGKPRGYALYVTDKRIFGIRSKEKRRKATTFEVMFGAAFGTPFGKEEVTKAIAELENEKEIEILRESVSEIKMKKPSQALRILLSLGYGYLQIETRTGQVLKIFTQYTKDFEALKRLMESFKPEVLHIS